MSHNARVQLEMGGKNPLVVLDDCDLDRAVQCALDGAFFATGQRCTASSRIIVTQGIHDKFVEALAARVKALKVGDALARRHADGSARQPGAARNHSLLYRHRHEGRRPQGRRWRARCTGDTRLLRGARADRGHAARTCASTAKKCSARSRPRVRVKDYDEALAVANAGEFGLSAGIMTSSLKYARHFVRNVRAGMVMTNLPTAGVDYHVPFGGTRKSSFGPREQGFAAVEFYTQVKTSYTWA